VRFLDISKGQRIVNAPAPSFVKNNKGFVLFDRRDRLLPYVTTEIHDLPSIIVENDSFEERQSCGSLGSPG
jgi:hypothetical protein